MTRNKHAMTAAERDEFLAEPLTAILSVQAEPGRAPLAVPMWYGYESGGDLTLITPVASRKAAPCFGPPGARRWSCSVPSRPVSTCTSKALWSRSGHRPRLMIAGPLRAAISVPKGATSSSGAAPRRPRRWRCSGSVRRVGCPRRRPKGSKSMAHLVSSSSRASGSKASSTPRTSATRSRRYAARPTTS